MKSKILMLCGTAMLVLAGMSIAAAYNNEPTKARQVCTAIDRNTNQTYIARSQWYPIGASIGDEARLEACSKAKVLCLSKNPGEPCECTPKSDKEGGSCTRETK
jgi:hypothetical protein